MTDKTKTKILLAVMGIAFICLVICCIASIVLSWQNPDMTKIRLFLTYPFPRITGTISAFILVICGIIAK